MRELARYRDALGRKTRLAIDDDASAWVRQEWRRGDWWTTERHPIKDLESVQGEPIPDDYGREVSA